jgi:hypothetical protein
MAAMYWQQSSLSLSLRTDVSDLSSEDFDTSYSTTHFSAAAVDEVHDQYGDGDGDADTDAGSGHAFDAVKAYSPSSAFNLSPSSSTGSPYVLTISPGEWRCLWCTVPASDTEGKHVGPDGPETLCDLCSRNYRKSKLQRAVSTIGGSLPLPPDVATDDKAYAKSERLAAASREPAT